MLYTFELVSYEVMTFNVMPWPHKKPTQKYVIRFIYIFIILVRCLNKNVFKFSDYESAFS